MKPGNLQLPGFVYLPACRSSTAPTRWPSPYRRLCGPNDGPAMLWILQISPPSVTT